MAGFFLIVGLCLTLVTVATAEEPSAAAKDESAGEGKFTDEQYEFFEKQVRPVLIRRCYECHGPELAEPKGGLRVHSRAALLAGGETGPSLVPGKPADSLLIDAVNYGDLYEMPPKSKLPATEIAALTRWVALGAPWPEEKAVAINRAKEFDLAERRAAHWSWRPVESPQPPAVKNAAWPAGPIDQFILARLEAAGLAPAADADRAALLRRVSLDLIGLPPTLEELDAFLRDESAAAYEKVVDRLLRSPHFGERWARHWMDRVRYAESRGHEFDYTAPNAWQYRDYLIRALNADVPYNQMVTEHLAGDLLPEPRRNPDEGFNESILATGYWFLGEWVHSPVDIRQDEADRFDNMVDVTTKTFLGLTVSCARCHDHKFDAISQRDYYALFGYLQSSAHRLARFDTLDHNRAVAEKLAALRATEGAALTGQLVAAQQPVLKRLEQYLLAAREAHGLLAAIAPAADKSKPAADKRPLSPEDRRLIEDLAAKQKLDAGLLAAWVEHLPTAAGDPQDPLHAWGKLVVAEQAGQPVEVAQLVQPILQATERSVAEIANPPASPARQTTVIDYADCSADAWLQDGSSFGPGPAMRGSLRLGLDPASPLEEVYTRSAARRDPAFFRLTIAAGTERSAGKMASLMAAGQTIRTPTFTVSEGPVHLLLSGQGHVTGVVNSHRMINGPLHGGLTFRFNHGRDLRWSTLNLSRYVGHDVHVEITAEDSGELSIFRVVQGGPAPPLPASAPLAPLFAELPAEGIKDAEALAGQTAAALRRAAQQLAAGEIGKESNLARSPQEPGAANGPAADCAPLANWLVQHDRLFTIAAEPARQQYQAAAAEFCRRHQALTDQVRRESRLAMAMWDGSGRDEVLMIRGSHKTPGPPVPRRLLESIAGPAQPAPSQGSGRLELAARMTDPTNPFITRVAVNRLWHHLLGRGIVASVDNFGVLGEAPTHPELLDYLAVQLVQEGWSQKELIRQIVLSRTYRMASQPSEAGSQLDPQNLLLHRARLRRLEGEVLRDQILAVSGRLDRKQFGPSVPVFLNEFMQGRGRPGNGPLDGNGRRSVYISIRRNFLSPMMLAFDTPSPFSTMGRRNVSNVPAQALILLNDPFVVQQAQLWAKRVLALPADASSPITQQRVNTMYRMAYARDANEAEHSAAEAFFARQAQQYNLAAEAAANDPRVWGDFAHVLINVKEFFFLR